MCHTQESGHDPLLVTKLFRENQRFLGQCIHAHEVSLAGDDACEPDECKDSAIPIVYLTEEQ